MRRKPLSRVVLGELLGSGVLVAVVLASGAVRVQLGALTLESALLGSVTLGFGYGLVVWPFGSLSGAQTSPSVSIVASVLGHQPWRQTALRIASQILGAATGFSLMVRLAPDTFTNVNAAHPVPSILGEGVAAFGFILVALGVAHRRDATVPLALGALATASFWMTGRATVGNPLLSVTVLSLVDGATPSAMLSALSVAAIGTGLAVVTSRFLFFEVCSRGPWPRTTPNRSRRAGCRRSPGRTRSTRT